MQIFINFILILRFQFDYMMKQITLYFSALLVAAIAFVTPAKSQTTPRIVVNIVVGTMQAEDLERYS